MIEFGATSCLIDMLAGSCLSNVNGLSMIAILNYGMGNLRSVQKALEKMSARKLLTPIPVSDQA